MMKFYSEHKFNPLAGCLPMLIQMPIFFALFSVLRDRVPAEAAFYDILPSLANSAGGVLGSDGLDVYKRQLDVVRTVVGRVVLGHGYPFLKSWMGMPQK